MHNEEIIRWWKDPLRDTVGPLELASAVPHPAGVIDLADLELEAVNGASTEHVATLGCCGGFTIDAGFCSLFCFSGVCQCTPTCTCGCIAF
jgi:mersacidin/lichenicidin family type 2 lantibiotic